MVKLHYFVSTQEEGVLCELQYQLAKDGWCYRFVQTINRFTKVAELFVTEVDLSPNSDESCDFLCCIEGYFEKYPIRYATCDSVIGKTIEAIYKWLGFRVIPTIQLNTDIVLAEMNWDYELRHYDEYEITNNLDEFIAVLNISSIHHHCDIYSCLCELRDSEEPRETYPDLVKKLFQKYDFFSSLYELAYRLASVSFFNNEEPDACVTRQKLYKTHDGFVIKKY